ncbi:hypothetical protein ACIGXM_08420 [Kitasatospora sp. NPDC052896]|uniref:hypothetical protein n=1 Tax=Kitasatospora sp. NPDC052896 TaxID=3364061 RepID=UPI0037CA46ED
MAPRRPRSGQSEGTARSASGWARTGPTQTGSTPPRSPSSFFGYYGFCLLLTWAVHLRPAPGRLAGV